MWDLKCCPIIMITTMSMTLLTMSVVIMIEDFILKALIMGLVFSCLAGPLGSVMVWRRLAFFGDTISHSALLGLGLSLIWQLPSQLILSLFCVGLAIILTLIPFRSKVSIDSILAIFSHGSLALGLVVLALMDRPPLSLTGFLFGDILALTWEDIIITALTALGVGALTTLFWRSLLTTFISEELAKSEGVPTLAIKVGFAIALGLTIGLLLQTVGALLMTAMLIIPASCARYLSRSPAQMVIIAIGVGALSFVTGLWSSYILDTPTAPMIVVSALGFFILSRLAYFVKR
ncbi:MAG TPA: hypothetical protein DD412_08200 [Holosporales bacterium]|nr:hypothetical protein [Holosporales bacterium]